MKEGPNSYLLHLKIQRAMQLMKKDRIDTSLWKFDKKSRILRNNTHAYQIKRCELKSMKTDQLVSHIKAITEFWKLENF